ncbi:auxin-responsive protein SAUR32-like [Oryza brachyantha]|uniref:auxin-responsive protein SAUR32-like n=1 Tax=Oryza brachyantha TaxID=4533 RepID=UPI001AD9E13D|nr:auxin-responsive protein SAUR32-like [Oryza brachyantha]
MLQGEEKKGGKVKKGWLAVRVGVEGGGDEGAGGFRRFVIPIAYLYHPLFQRLLEAARDAYGYDAAGPLRLPCSVDEFLRLRSLVERETQAAGGGGGSSSSSPHRVHASGGSQHHHYSFSPCTRAKVSS